MTMHRRDFVKRLSALAALPILPAFLRHVPPPMKIRPTPAEMVESGRWHRYVFSQRPGQPMQTWIDGVRQPDIAAVPYAPPLNAKSQRALDEGRTLRTSYWRKSDA